VERWIQSSEKRDKKKTREMKRCLACESIIQKHWFCNFCLTFIGKNGRTGREQYISQKTAIRNLRYYRKNKNAIIDRQRTYGEDNKESIAKYQRNYAQVNSESLRAYKKGWKERKRIKREITKK